MEILDRVCSFLSSVFSSSNNAESRRAPQSQSQRYQGGTCPPYRYSSDNTPSWPRQSSVHESLRNTGRSTSHSTTTTTTGEKPQDVNKCFHSLPDKQPTISSQNSRDYFTSATDKPSAYANSSPFAQSNFGCKATPSRSYSIKKLKLKVESLPKDRSFICQSDVVYHNQWTTVNAIIVDVYENQENISGLVELTSNSCIEFRNAKLENGRLKFSMKASDAGIVATLKITIHKYSDNNTYIVTKNVNVIYNPCSSTLSEVTINDIVKIEPTSKCVFRIHIIDVFGDPAAKNSPMNNYEFEIVDFESDRDQDVKVENSIHLGDNCLCFDLSVQAERPWSNKIGIYLNGEQLKPAGKYELPHEEQHTLLRLRSVAISDDNYESIPSSVIYDTSRVCLPIAQHCDDGKFEPFHDEMCQISNLPPGTANYRLVCKNTTKHVIMGPDYAHINNIKRVLELKDRLEIEETSNQTSIIFGHCNLSLRDLCNCKELVLHLLRGSYYRKKASDCARVRMEWKEKFNSLCGILHPPHSSPTLKFSKYFKDHYGDLMNKYNHEACEELFTFFNYIRDESEVDLHGLLVADEERLNALKLDLLRGSLSDKEIDDIIRNSCRLQSYKGRKLNVVKRDLMRGSLSAEEVDEFIERCETITNGNNLENLRRDLVKRCNRSKEVDEIIDRWREESDEAIRMLKKKLEDFDLEKAVENNSPWVEIIVGAGHHSRRKETQNIRPKVEKLLKERGNKFVVVNKGSLVVTFIEYSGPEPCFGEYYCSTCDRCWKSSKSYKGKYQKCSRCNRECWPVKQRKKQRVLNYRRDGKEEQKKSKPHQSHLCQRCTELGYPCNTEDYYSDYE